MKWLALVIPVALFGLFFAVGVFILGTSAYEAWRSYRAARWPTVAGRVKSVALREDVTGKHTNYIVEAEYTYCVAEVSYEGSCLAIGYGGSHDREASERLFKRLQCAKTVEVRYDPDWPATSTLSPGTRRDHFVGLWFGTMWLSFVLGAALIPWLGARANDDVLNGIVVREVVADVQE